MGGVLEGRNQPAISALPIEAAPLDVLGEFLTWLGLVGGIALSYALRRSLNGLLYGIKPADPAIWAAGIAALLLAGFFATAIPAARAARVDPASMLRDE